MNNFYYVLPTLIFLCVSTISFGQFDLEYYQLKGTVKEVAINTLEINDSKKEKGNSQQRKSYERISFNKKGYEDQRWFTIPNMPDDTSNIRFKYAYDNKVIQEITNTERKVIDYDHNRNKRMEVVTNLEEEEEPVF